MKVIIAGSRKIKEEVVDDFLSNWYYTRFPFWPDEIVSGMCPNSPDFWAINWALKHGRPIKPFPANWDELGKGAGHIRNIEMARYADALIAFWDGESNGTHHMITQMLFFKKPVHVEIIKTETSISKSEG